MGTSTDCVSGPWVTPRSPDIHCVPVTPSLVNQADMVSTDKLLTILSSSSVGEVLL